MNENLDLLLWKRAGRIEELLKEAVARGRVQNSYLPPEPKKNCEDVSEYLERIIIESSAYQFVRVVAGGRSQYVAFGVPGPILVHGGKFFLVPAEVVGGDCGVHYCLMYPDLPTLREQKNIFIRLASGCLSGQVFGDITCDCREQLELAKSACLEKGAGIIIHIPSHDGRGWGEYKLANQRIMDEFSLDAIEAAALFYGDREVVDQRTYHETIIILRAFGFGGRHSFCFATNNPRKVGAFRAFGLTVTETLPVAPVVPNIFVRRNLRAKLKDWRYRETVRPHLSKGKERK